MRKYIRPDAEIRLFAVEDIITVSGFSGTGGAVVDVTNLPASSVEMYSIYKENSSVKNTNVSVFTW